MSLAHADKIRQRISLINGLENKTRAEEKGALEFMACVNSLPTRLLYLLPECITPPTEAANRGIGFQEIH
jgi:hypothetical protein